MLLFLESILSWLYSCEGAWAKRPTWFVTRDLFTHVSCYITISTFLKWVGQLNRTSSSRNTILYNPQTTTHSGGPSKNTSVPDSLRFASELIC